MYKMYNSIFLVRISSSVSAKMNENVAFGFVFVRQPSPGSLDEQMFSLAIDMKSQQPLKPNFLKNGILLPKLF